jgi:ABC-2 type transport system permease protein
MLPFSVPMMYPYTLVHKRFESFPLIEHFYLFNPVAEAVLLMQRCFWITTIPRSEKGKPEWGFQPGLTTNFPPHLFARGLICIAFGVLFLAFAQWVFSRLDDKIPDRLIG